MDLNSSDFLKKKIIWINILLAVLFGVISVYAITIYNKSYKQIIENDGQYYQFNLENLPINFTNNQGEEKVSDVVENVKQDSEQNSNTQNDSNKANTAPLSSKKINKIAILVANIGTNKKITELALKLPKEVSIGILPHTKNLNSILDRVTNSGHESYIYLPLELNSHAASLNQWTLFSNLSIDQNIDRLSTMVNYLGDKKYNLYTSPDEKLSQSPELLSSILNYLSNKDISCIWSNLDNLEILQERKNIKFVDIIIDPNPEKNVIENNLRLLLYMAQKNGYVIGYLNGYNVSIDILNKWLSNVEEYNVKLVHISTLLNIKNDKE